MSDDEETRAQLYRNQVRTRNAAWLARERALSGSPAYALQVRESWAAIRDRNIDIPDIPEYGLDEEDE